MVTFSLVFLEFRNLSFSVIIIIIPLSTVFLFTGFS